MPIESDVPDLPEGVRSVNIKEQKVFDGLSFPLILSPSDDFKDKNAQFWNDWVKKNLKEIEILLLKYGVILYRGFPLDTPNDFNEFIKAYGYDPFNNVSAIGVRNHVVGNVYTTFELPPGSVTPPHHEMGHVKDYPLIMFFYCDIPAKEGGNTPIALSNIIYRKMAEREPDFVNRLEKEGQRYYRIATNGDDPSHPYGRGWQSMFYASSKEEAEEKAKSLSYDFEWLEDGSFKYITEILPAIRVDKRTGKKMWFNTIFSFAVVKQREINYNASAAIFPNGESISDETLEVLKQVMAEAKVTFKWQHTDALMVDNRTVQHCREDFCIPPRRILLSLLKDHQGPL